MNAPRLYALSSSALKEAVARLGGRRRLCLLGLSLSASALLAKLLALFLRVQRQKRMIADVPLARYRHARFFGYWPDMLANRCRLHDWRKEISEGMPASKLVGLEADTEGVLMICRDPVAVKHFLKDAFQNYTKPGKMDRAMWYYMNEWLGGGIFTVRHGSAAPDGGHSWSRQRKIASGIFSRGNFNSTFQRAFAEKAQRLFQTLEKPASQGQRVDMQKQFFCFTMDSVMKIFFGEETDTVGGVMSTYGSAYDSAHNSLMDVIMGNALGFKVASVLPWPFGAPGGLFWKLMEMRSPAYWRFRKAVRTLDQESSRLVKDCRSDPKLAERTDLLALFVKSEEEDQFSVTFLRDVVLNMIIAGRDTTACTLSWLFYILATNPDVQEKLCREIDQKHSNGQELSFKQLSASEMPYLNGVVYETLRLFPPVPLDAKKADRDDVLPGGTPVPAGAELIFLPYAMGRDASLYKEPEQVCPERWIPFQDPAPHEFPVFQAGPRICLGKEMAIFEVKLLVSTLLRGYNFELAPGEAEKITYNNTFTLSICNSQLQDSHNLWLLPKKREHFWN